MLELDEAAGTAVYPIRELLEGDDLPLAGLLDADALAPLLDSLFYTEAVSWVHGPDLFLAIELAFEGELSLTPPGLEAITIALGTATGGWTRVATEIVIGSDPSMRIVNVPVTLRVREDILRDVALNRPTELTFSASVTLSSAGLDIEYTNELDLPLSEVAGSGVQVAMRKLSWNFRPGETLPRAQAAGLEAEFIGFACETAELHLDDLIAGFPDLLLENCLIGTGGFSGTTAAQFDPVLTLDLSGFVLDVSRIAVGFRESRLVLGEIEATLRNMPFFDTDVAVRLEVAEGGVRVQLLPTNGALLELRKPGLIRMTVASAELSVRDGVAALVLSGSIQLEVTGPSGIELPAFEIKNLRIASDGTVSIDGGLINLPEGTRVSIGGFGLELSQVGLGTEPNGDRFVTFSGGLHLGEGIPLSATVEGLKVIWNQGGLVGVELAGIALSFEIEGTLRFDGKIHFDDANNRFDGAGRVELIALQMSVEARILIAKQDQFTALFIYLLLRSPVGIPLFATGLAFYGFEALYGQHVEPDKSAPELWYRDWYRRADIGAVDTRKWEIQHNSYAFGAGIILGTLPDGGYAISAKGLLLIVIPGPILMLEVKANLLRDPTALTRPNEPATFNALVVYDGRAGSIELSIEPRYAFPDGGELIEIAGIAEAFYSFSDPRRWYLYLGRREREKRIRAGLLKIFEANAYLMLDRNSLELGGFIGYDTQIDAGPVHLVIQAFMEAMAGVSWRPKQLKGMLHMCGKIELKVMGIGFGLGLRALLAAEAPHPFHLLAELAIEIGLPWPIPDLELEVSLEWSDPLPARVVSPLQSVAMEHPLDAVSWALVPGQEPVVPRDGRIILLFDRGMNIANSPATTIALDTPPPAESMASGDYLLRTSIAKIRLEIDRGGVWTSYVHTDPNGNTVVPRGVWQEQSGDRSNSNRRLMIDARTPFDWERQLGGSTLTQLARADETSPCDPYVRLLLITFDDSAETSHGASTTFEYRGLVWQLDVAGAEVIALSRFARRGGIELGTSPGFDLPYRGLLLRASVQLVNTTGNVGAGNFPGNQPRAFHLRIDLVQSALGISVLAYATENWTLQAFDANLVSLGRVEWNPPPGSRAGDYMLAELTLERNSVRFIEVSVTGSLGLLILRFAIKIAPIGPDRDAYREQVEELIESFRSIAPVFEPNSRYKLTVTSTVEDANSEPRSLENAVLEKTDDTQAVQVGNRVEFQRVFIFRTEGPPGGAQLTPLEGPSDGDLNLATLDSYVDYSIPSAGAVTHYCNYDLSIQFKVDYIAHLYESDGRQLEIAITDQAGRSIVLTNRAGQGRAVSLREHEQTWLEIAGNACNLIVPQDEFVKATEVHAFTRTSLEPRTRYELVLKSNPPTPGEAVTPLYKTSFLTSEFLNFRDHFKIASRVAPGSLSLGQLSFADWTGMLSETLQAGDPFGASGTEREALRLIETDAFDALFGSIVNVERELPGKVRLTKVQRAAQTWAMLLESPEPWPWERMQLNCHVVPAPPRSPFDLLGIDVVVSRDDTGILRVGNATVKASFRSDTDLRGYTLEVEASEGRWRRSYRIKHLGKEAIFRANDQVTLELDAGPRRRVPLLRRLLVGVQEFLGLRARGLPDLRLRDPEGRVVVTFPGVVVELGDPFPIRVVRDFDGTRALLLALGPGGAATFGAGTYMLEGTFKRSTIPDLPPLSERNNYSDEVARIFWTI